MVNLVGSCCVLDELELGEFDRWDNATNGLVAIVEGLKTIESAVQVMLLPRLTLGQCELLLEGLPAFRNLQDLRFSVESESLDQKDNRFLPAFRLLSAFRRHGRFSLRSAAAAEPSLAQLKDSILSAFRENSSVTNTDQVKAPFLNETDCSLLRSYACRNEDLPGLIESVTSEKSTNLQPVPRLSTRSFEATAAVGPNDVYQALLRLGDRVGSNNNCNCNATIIAHADTDSADKQPPPSPPLVTTQRKDADGSVGFRGKFACTPAHKGKAAAAATTTTTAASIGNNAEEKTNRERKKNRSTRKGPSQR